MQPKLSLSKTCACLVQYLYLVLFSNIFLHLATLLLIREVILHPTPSEIELLHDASVADGVIELLGNKAISTLANLVVSSPTFRTFKTSKMLQHFDRHLNKGDDVRSEPTEVRVQKL